MESENLWDNVFFVRLVDHAHLMRTVLACPSNYLLCVPQSLSLRGFRDGSIDAGKLDKLLSTHVIRLVVDDDTAESRETSACPTDRAGAARDVDVAGEAGTDENINTDLGTRQVAKTQHQENERNGDRSSGSKSDVDDNSRDSAEENGRAAAQHDPETSGQHDPETSGQHDPETTSQHNQATPHNDQAAKPNLFRTLNHKAVCVKGTNILAKIGFPSERTVSILCSEEIRISRQDLSEEVARFCASEHVVLSVVHIDRPLEGGAAVPCAVTDFSSEQVENLLYLLRQYPETEGTFQELDEFVEEIVSLAPGDRHEPRVNPCVAFYQALEGLLSHGNRARLESELGDPLLDYPAGTPYRMSVFTEDAGAGLVDASESHPFDETPDPLDVTIKRQVVYIGSRLFDAIPHVLSRDDLRSQWTYVNLQIHLAVESYIYKYTYEPLIDWMRKLEFERDQNLNDILDLMLIHSVTEADLGIRIDFQCTQRDAVKGVLEIQRHRTPLQKLLCVKRVVSSINESVEENVQAKYGSVQDYELTTDDLLDQLIFVLIQARSTGLKDIASQLRFIRCFHFVNLDTTALGFFLANMEVAVEWLLTRGRELVANKPPLAGRQMSASIALAATGVMMQTGTQSTG